MRGRWHDPSFPLARTPPPTALDLTRPGNFARENATSDSFPNSGTSFTSLLVRHASNATAATNYGMESRLGPDGRSVPVYDWSKEGPYWLHPPGDEYDAPPAAASILTKTHCGGRCASCPPDRYLETEPSFLERCLSGSRKVRKSSGGGKEVKYEKQYQTYRPELVERAVHLVRDPFDNLVSRFHHEQKEHKKKGQKDWTRRYSNDVAGFRRWCADEDRHYAAAEDAADWEKYGIPADLPRRFEGVSCHGELLRYVRWHVLALKSTEALGVPVLYVHYEDYAADLEAATGRVLDFLHLERRAAALPRFDGDKDYGAYFTREERACASDFMREVADEGGRRLLERYWVDWDFGKMLKETKSIK